VQRRIDPRVQMRQMVQRAHQIDGNQASGDLESRLNASKGGGSPLSENVRGFMEPRFGADFSGVRVHTGSEAVQINQELGAQAFTHGSDVYFGAGKSPGNNELTAHELTHFVQQGAAPDTQQQLTNELNNTHIQSKKIHTKIAAVTAEIAARTAINATCFRGGNKTHRDQVTEKNNMMMNCYRYFDASNCPQRLVQAMEEVVERARKLVEGAVTVAVITAFIAAIIVLGKAIIAVGVAGTVAAGIAAVIVAIELALKQIQQVH